MIRWLAAAETAKKLKRDKHYIVKEIEEKGKKYREVYIVDDEGHIIEGSVFANGAHQLLTAKLQQEEKHKEGIKEANSPESNNHFHLDLGMVLSFENPKLRRMIPVISVRKAPS